MQIKTLLGDKLLLEVILVRKWGNGIVVTPPGYEKLSDEAIIRLLGDGYNGSLSVGDRVLYDRNKGESIKNDGKLYLIQNAGDIMAKVEV